VLQCKAEQCHAVQYNKIQYNITPITYSYNSQGNSLYTKLQQQKNQEHTLYTIKTQKRVEPKVDESVLKTTVYTKQ